MIRITGGACRGRALHGGIPEGVRPTAARVREALFNVVGNDLRGWSFLDLFGGSGLVALEAASRGAGPVRVVERNPRAAAAIRGHAAVLGLPVEVLVADAARVALDPADVVFLDPPYREDIGPWLARAAGFARRVLVAEVASAASGPEVAGFSADRPRRYGGTTLLLYERIGSGAVHTEAPVVLEDPGVVEDDRRG